MTIETPEAKKTTGFWLNLVSHPYILLAAATLSWGGNAVAGKAAVAEITPQLLLSVRWLGASLVLLVLAMPHLKKDWHLIKRHILLLSSYGIFGFAIFNMLMYSAAHHTSAINISIEQGSIPVLVLLANFLIFKVRAKPLQIVGLAITLLGVVWVATHGQPSRILSLDVNFGDGLMLIACALYAAYSLALKFRPPIHWLSFLCVAAIGAFVTSIIVQTIASGDIATVQQELQSVTTKGWALAAYIIIFPAILGQLFYARGVAIIGANRASVFINLVPIIGTVFAVLLLKEKFEMFHFVAAALVLCGIFLSEFTTRAAPHA